MVDWLRQGVVGVGLLVVLSGCGSAATSPSSTAVNAADLQNLPACAYVGTPIGRPAAFPATFPLPPGTVLNYQESRSGGRIIIGGVAPSTAHDVAVYWEQAMPQAGYRQTSGESEPGEAEASFEGHGYRGRWKVNDMPDCPNIVMLSLVAGP
jgi:hypothetical protein